MPTPTTCHKGRAKTIAKILNQLNESERYSTAAGAREQSDIMNIFTPAFKEILSQYKRLEFFTPVTGQDLTYTVGTVAKSGKPDATIGAKGEGGILYSLMELEFKSGR